MKIVRFLVLALCMIGAGLSALSLHNHYATSATDYCDLSQTFNCDLVNRSTYSAIHGVPVALLGLLGYLVLFVLSWRATRRSESLRFVASLIGLAFALYLAYIEAYILAVWCLLCIGSMIAILGITLLTGIGLWQSRTTEPKAYDRR